MKHTWMNALSARLHHATWRTTAWVARRRHNAAVARTRRENTAARAHRERGQL